MEWIGIVILGGYAYTTIMVTWIRKDLRALWRVISNETQHDLEDLRKRVTHLEDKSDGR